MPDTNANVSTAPTWIDVRAILPEGYDDQVAEVTRLLDAIEPISHDLKRAWYRLANGYEAATSEHIAEVVALIPAEQHEHLEAADGLPPLVSILSGYTTVTRRIRDFADQWDSAADEAGARDANGQYSNVPEPELPEDPRARCHALAAFAEQLATGLQWLVEQAGPVMGKLEAQRVREGLEDDEPMFQRQAFDGTARMFHALWRIDNVAGVQNDPKFLGLDYARAGLETCEPQYREACERQVRDLEEAGATY